MNRPATPSARRAAPATPSTAPRQDGLTIIELLVVLLLSAILTAGLFYMISGQSRAYRNQLTNMTTQENLWGAMEFLQRNFRMAGFGMGHCPGAMILQYDSSGGGTPAWIPPNTKPWIPPIRVYNGCNLYTDTNAPPCPTSVVDSPDSFSVAFSEAADGMIAVRIVQPVTTSASTNPILVATPGPFGPNDLIALWQPGTIKHCTLLQLSNAAPQAVGSSWELPRVPGGTTINPPDTTDIFPAGGYESGALVVKVFELNAGLPPVVVQRHFAVKIDPSRPEVIPQLVTWTLANKSDVEVVADGVEDMQISFGCDDTTPPDGVLTEGTDPAARQTDEWAHNVDTEADGDGDGLPDPIQCRQGIGAIRISLIARSPSQADTKAENKRPKAEDRPEGAALDAYTRRRLTTVVYPRNMRPPQ